MDRFRQTLMILILSSKAASSEHVKGGGWLWAHSKEDSKSEEAIAGTPYNAIIFDDEINIFVEDSYGASAAEALLAVYIAAVREGAKR